MTSDRSAKVKIVDNHSETKSEQKKHDDGINDVAIMNVRCKYLRNNQIVANLIRLSW